MTRHNISLVNQTVFSVCAFAFKLVGGGNAEYFFPQNTAGSRDYMFATDLLYIYRFLNLRVHIIILPTLLYISDTVRPEFKVCGN